MAYFFTFKFSVEVIYPRFFQEDGPKNGYSQVFGESNGGYLGNKILIKKVDHQDLEVGHFVVSKSYGEYVVHPIIRMVRIDGETVGYVTKGIINKYEDEILLPHQIVGRAFKVLEDGSVEADTKYESLIH